MRFIKEVVGLRTGVAVTSNGACVCLDTGGWIAGALDDFIRRRTGSDDFVNLLRVVTGQWGALKEVPAGAALRFGCACLLVQEAVIRRRRFNCTSLLLVPRSVR